MPNQQLLQYIVTQEHAGYSELQIRQALGQNGYQQADIDAAFRDLKPHTDAQVNDEVRTLVQQYANQGYSPLQVFNALTQQGQHAGAIRKAIKDVYGPLMMPNSHTGAIVFAILAIIIVGAGIFLITGKDGPGEDYVLPADDIELSTTQQITQIVGMAASEGKEGAIQQCMGRFFDDDRGRCLAAVATYPTVNDDRICDQIVQYEIRDACLMNFVNENTESVCSRVQLRENIDLCETLVALSSAKA